MSLHTTSLPTFSLLTSSLLTPWAVLAQQRDTIVLEPVVVTATRLPMAQDAVAAAVVVLRGDALRAQGLRTVAEALRGISSAAVVETGSHGGQTSLFLRGGESDYVKVLLDGVPLNRPGGSFDFADLTLDNVERIEVVRGPASVLYGSDAMTGVVQIITRAGRGAPRLGVAARAGRYGTSDLSAELTGGGPRAGFALAASRFGSDGLYPYNNGYRNTALSARLHVAPDARTEARLSYRWGDNVYHFPTNERGQPVDSNQYSAERGPAASLELTSTLAGGLQLQALATLSEQRVRYQDEPDSPGQGGGFESSDLVRRAAVGALASWRGGTGTVLTIGVEYDDASQRGRSAFETFPDSVDVQRWNRAAYAQALLAPAQSLSANVGLRVEDNSQFGGYATWRAGVVYRLDDATRLRASAGTGFKEPTFFENFARGVFRGNPHLDPERSTSWEAGLGHTVGPVTLAVTYFDQRFRDLIEFTFTRTGPDSVNYFNVAGATAHGVEASLEAALGRGIVAALHYTYLDTRVSEPGLDPGPDAAFSPGRRLLRRPDHTVGGSVRASIGARGLVALDARVVGERDDLDFARSAGERRVTLAPYARVNLGAEYDVIPARVTLTLRVENVLDDDAGEIANFPTRRRTLLIGGELRYGA